MSFTFDGFDLTQYAYARIERPIGPSLRVDAEQVPGRDGEIYLGSTREPLTINARMTLKPHYIRAWASVRRILAAALAKTGECRLTLPDEPGTYRMATASLSDNVTAPLVHPVEFGIEFTCRSPIAYALAEKTATLPSGGSVTLNVDGSLPARCKVVAASAVRNSSTNLWGVRLDSADYMRVELSTSSSRRVEIDAENRTAKVANATSMITLDSSWLEMSPGQHTLTMDQGTGAATVSWFERWL